MQSPRSHLPESGCSHIPEQELALSPTRGLDPCIYYRMQCLEIKIHLTLACCLSLDYGAINGFETVGR